jgi:hypothetical protein
MGILFRESGKKWSGLGELLTDVLKRDNEINEALE